MECIGTKSTTNIEKNMENFKFDNSILDLRATTVFIGSIYNRKY